jgi:hypothetical protein
MSKGLTQAYELRDVTHRLAMELGEPAESEDKEAKRARARDVALLVRAWSEADDHVRIHRGKPLPGVLRPDSKRVKKRAGNQPSPQPVVSCGAGAEKITPIPKPAEPQSAVATA